MKENLTEIVFILDRSGSMYNLVNDTIGGFNSFIETQSKEESDAILTTILFDDQYEILHNGVNLKDVEKITNKEYYTRGMTALLDAIGKTMNIVSQRLDNTPEDEKPSKIIFVITIDGHENSSIEFTQPQIQKMVEEKTNKHNWQFLFLGANIDAIATAQKFGIQGQFASNYTASSVGTDSLFRTVSKSVSNYIDNGKIEGNWNEDIN